MKIRNGILSILAAALLPLAGPVMAEQKPLKIWSPAPAAYWEEAYPVGNGRIGGMVFGGGLHERIQLNEDTLWSGEPKEWNNPDAPNWLPKVREALFNGDYHEADQLAKHMQGPFNQSYQPLCDLFIDFVSDSKPEGFYRELDLDSGVALTRFSLEGVNYEQRVFSSFPDQVLVVALAADKPGALNFDARMSSPHPCEIDASKGDLLELSGKAPAHVDHDGKVEVAYENTPEGRGMRFVSLLRAITKGGTVEASKEKQLSVRNADSVCLLFSADTSFNGPDRSPSKEGVDPRIEAQANLNQAASKTPDELRQRHVADHQGLFRRVSMDLGDSKDSLPTRERVIAYQNGEEDPGLVALIFQYGRYLMIASSRPGSQPANLQGIWNPHVRPPWCSNYTMNINSEMNYWPSENCNLGECHQPMLDYIADLARHGAVTARVNYNAPGWVAHHNGDLWRQSAPPGEYGKGSPHWASFNMTGPWHSMDLWEHYQFRLDKEYLRDFAYPIMKGAAEFCLAWLVPDGKGHLVTAPSTSTENSFLAPDGKPAQLSIGSTQDMALIWDLFSNCIRASEALDADAEFRSKLIEARAKLLPYQIGGRGQLQEWSVDFGEPEPHHRHVSHLIGLFPGSQITPESSPDLAQAVRASLELRGDDSTGWSMAWKVNLWARLKDGDRARRLLGYLLRLVENSGTVYTHGGGVYPNLFDAHPPFQIDGNFGAAAGIAEMLLQSHRRDEQGRFILELAPALPEAWKHVTVDGLRARGGVTVSLACRDGNLTEATLTADNDIECAVLAGGKSQVMSLRKGEKVQVPIGK